MRTAVAVLAHVLLAIGLVGEVLTVALTAPDDPTVLSTRVADVLLAVLIVGGGWVLAWKRPRIPIGWLLLALGVINAPAGPASARAAALASTDPVGAGWAYTFGFESRWIWIPTLAVLVVIIPLRFPTGHLPSPRWRWFARFAVTAVLVGTAAAMTIGPTFAAWVAPRPVLVPNPLYLPWIADAAKGAIVLPSLLVAAIGSLVSLVVRYRGAGSIERAQLRWLFWAVAIVVGWQVLESIENASFGDESTRGLSGTVASLLDVVAGFTFCLVPFAILVGVLRYGLYAIDRIISRTASYSIVTLLVVGTYLAAVLLLSLLLPNAQALGVALPTLAAAAVFLPLLRWVRRIIDRRFDRAQYDAERVVVEFGERVRNGADPHTAGADLLDAVERTLQPSAVGIWTVER